MLCAAPQGGVRRLRRMHGKGGRQRPPEPMGMKQEDDVNEREREQLIRVRAQAMLVARLRERTAEESRIALRAIRLDAVPKSGGPATGLDAGMIRREEMARVLAREEALLKQMEWKARQAMEGMKPELYVFCALILCLVALFMKVAF